MNAHASTNADVSADRTVDASAPTAEPTTAPGVFARAHAQSRPTVSFELMPPRNPSAAPKFWETTRQLLTASPDFISVTYGAAGTDRDTAREVIERLVRHTPVVPIAHLTCVGASRENVADVIDEFLASGVRSFLALRGDPPISNPGWQPDPNSVASSIELVHLLREVDAARCQAHPGSALRAAARPLTISVATFPGGNAAAGTTAEQEAHRLLEKQQAGANFAITQLFYEADTYLEFVERTRALGVTIPILAGVLPTTDPGRLRRVEELIGVPLPTELVATLDAADEASRYDIGLEHATRLVQRVLDGGAPGLHIYTFNKYQAALDLLSGVGLHPPADASPIAPLISTPVSPLN